MLGWSIRRNCEQQLAVPRLRRVAARGSHPTRWVVVFAQIEHGEVAKLVGDELYDFCERILEIETGCQHLPQPGERALLALDGVERIEPACARLPSPLALRA